MNLEQIDTSTTAGKARVMQLAAEGWKVRWRFRGDAQWLVDVGDDWDWKSCEYAIISEPVGPEEVWLTYADGGALQCTSRSKPSWDVDGVKHVRYIRADLAGEGK